MQRHTDRCESAHQKRPADCTWLWIMPQSRQLALADQRRGAPRLFAPAGKPHESLTARDPISLSSASLPVPRRGTSHRVVDPMVGYPSLTRCGAPSDQRPTRAARLPSPVPGCPDGSGCRRRPYVLDPDRGRRYHDRRTRVSSARGARRRQWTRRRVIASMEIATAGGRSNGSSLIRTPSKGDGGAIDLW